MYSSIYILFSHTADLGFFPVTLPERHGMLPLESDPFPLLSLSHIHFDTPVTKKDSINGIMRDVYPMDLFSLLLKMHGSNPVILKALDNEKSDLFMDVFRFSSRSMKNRNDS